MKDLTWGEMTLIQKLLLVVIPLREQWLITRPGVIPTDLLVGFELVRSFNLDPAELDGGRVLGLDISIDLNNLWGVALK